MLAEDAGRDPVEIGVSYSAPSYDDRRESTTPDGERRAFSGSVEQVAGDIRDFEELGVKHLMLGLQADSLSEALARMERFVAEVRPLARG